MESLYAYFRLTDDLADEPGAGRVELQKWRERTVSALAGRFSHPIHPALHDSAKRYSIPTQELLAVIDGAESDLGGRQFPRFSPELETYCYQVAGVVGRACVRVWGVRNPADLELALEFAVAAGIAFQITNILRDLGEDLTRGRVYLPEEDLARFGCPPGSWQSPELAGKFRELMSFQIARARQFYDRSEPIAKLLTREGRAVFSVMTGVYRRLLDEIERRDFDVFSRRVRISKYTKARIFLTGWPVKWGWM